MTQHNHEHHEGCGHSHQHDPNAHTHCHCTSCTMEQQAGNGETEGSTGCCGGEGTHAHCCGSGGSDGGEEEDEPAHKHSQGESCGCAHEHGDHDDEHDDGCGCGHDHEHGEALSLKKLAILGGGAVLFGVAVVLQDALHPLLALGMYLATYFVIGGDVLLRAFKNILRGQVFDENFLMAIATIGAFIVGDYPEGISVMLFYQVGELFQSYAVGRSRRSISELMDIRPDHANLLREDGTTAVVSPAEIYPGAHIIIMPGERIPLDSRVLSGSSFVDTAALTGESVPRSVKAGDALLSGCINQSGLLEAEVTASYGQSTVAKILELTENASSQKAKAQQFITRFAKVYTPAVVLAAVLLALLPPLLLPLLQPVLPALAGVSTLWSDWVYRALVFLVISCPCALVISIPLSFFGGIGGASRCGVLVKGGNYLEALAQADIVVFDKTGTLTKGSFAVTETSPADGVTSHELLAMAAAVECFSTHPIARSVVAAAGSPPDKSLISGYTELSGRGVTAVVAGRQVAAGNRKLMQELGIAIALPVARGTEVLVAIDGSYSGRLVISDTVKEDAAKAIAALKALGVRKTVMLTGDAQAAAEIVAAQTGVDEFHAQLLPGDKVAQVEKLMQQRAPGGTLIFVGDGINDAPVLARADVGVAMGGLGSDAAIEAADVVLMTDQPLRLAAGIRIARRTSSIVRQNVAFALGVKLLVMVLGAVGLAGMWGAVFADVGVSVLAILNATRALNTKKLVEH